VTAIDTVACFNELKSEVSMNSTLSRLKTTTTSFLKPVDEENCMVCGSNALSIDEVFDELAGSYELVFCNHCRFQQANRLRTEPAPVRMPHAVEFDMAS
jgi:hypothetical protein